MRKNWFLILAMIILAALFIVGCGDDDDDNVAAPTVPATFTHGEIYTYDDNGLYFYIYTYVYGGANPGIDSILVDTMKADIDNSYYWNIADPYWYSQYYENDEFSTYASGDTVTVKMYGAGRSSTCNISLLDYDDDEANIITPDYGTYVDTGATVEIVWNKIDNAEYYALSIESRYDSSGTMLYDYDYAFTHDTTYTLPAQYTDTTIDYFYFYVLPTCGPNPESYTGNWTGTFTVGILYSYGDYDYTRVYVSSDPPLMKAASTSKEDDVAPNKTPREIIQGVYGLDR